MSEHDTVAALSECKKEEECTWSTSEIGMTSWWLRRLFPRWETCLFGDVILFHRIGNRWRNLRVSNCTSTKVEGYPITRDWNHLPPLQDLSWTWSDLSLMCPFINVVSNKCSYKQKPFKLFEGLRLPMPHADQVLFLYPVCCRLP